MRFLVDVNASGTVAAWLVEAGHDVVEVADRDPQMSDKDVLDWAVRDERIVVTTDRDFEEMIWREGRSHNGLLRLENLPRAERIVLLRDVLAHHGRSLQSGAIVIASSSKIRIRKR
jgi:predicted nuclease of predicted toxin-antitoxin system